MSSSCRAQNYWLVECSQSNSASFPVTASTACEHYLLFNDILLVKVFKKVVRRAKEQSKPHYQQAPLNSANPTDTLETNSRLPEPPLPDSSHF